MLFSVIVAAIVPPAAGWTYSTQYIVCISIPQKPHALQGCGLAFLRKKPAEINGIAQNQIFIGKSAAFFQISLAFVKKCAYNKVFTLILHFLNFYTEGKT
jgi:hypothetical protein